MKNIFFFPPGGAKELKLSPLDSKSKFNYLFFLIIYSGTSIRNIQHVKPARTPFLPVSLKLRQSYIGLHHSNSGRQGYLLFVKSTFFWIFTHCDNLRNFLHFFKHFIDILIFLKYHEFSAVERVSFSSTPKNPQFHSPSVPHQKPLSSIPPLSSTQRGRTIRQ